MKWLIGVLVVTTVIGSSVTPPWALNSVALSPSPGIDIAFIDVDSAPGMHTVFVVARSWFGLRGIEFAAPPPECAQVLVLGESPRFPATGSIESGISIDFGQCLTGMIDVMSITFFTTGIDTCCPWGIVQHPGSLSGDVEGFDCDSSRVYVRGRMNTLRPRGRTDCGYPTVPKNPFPPDGATDQPLFVTLDWESQPTAGTNLGVFFCNVEFGTVPDPPIELWNIGPPQGVGPLLPDTTYYWRVTAIVTDYGSTTGPLWHFRTGGLVAVHKSTWGAIKALYR